MLPNDRRDPTGQNSRELQAAAALRARVTRCVAVYRDVLKRIEFVPVNNARTYEFRTLPGVLAAWLQAAEEQVDAIMLEGGTTAIWFAAQFVEQAYQTGAARNRANLAAQSVVYKAARPDLRSLLLSEPYQRRLALLYAREFEEMKGLGNTIKKDMAQILTAGMANGQGPIEIARQMTAQLGIEKRRAERIARTEINNAHTNARMDQATDARENLGLDSREMHISALSPTTRQTHRDRHGTLHTVQAQREWWSRDGNRINCYLPGTRVRGEFVAGSKGHYRGDVIHIVTAGGRNLTVTPNHPVLTPGGLVAACNILKGDDLLTYAVDMEDSTRVGALHDEHGDAKIEHVFASLLEVGHAVRLGVAAVDFHGDGAFFDEDVDVVRTEGLLAVGLDAHLRQSLDGLKLEHADSILAHAGGSVDAHLPAIDLSAPSFVSGSGESLAVLGGSGSHSQMGGIAHCASLNAALPQHPGYDGTTDTERLGDCLFGDAGPVLVDNVVSVEVLQWCGHVYDLEEKSGLMVANGIIASNCKCSTVTVLVDKAGRPLSPRLVAAAQAQKTAP
jgi:hypothetical protein